jgi:hypothetical protein
MLPVFFLSPTKSGVTKSEVHILSVLLINCFGVILFTNDRICFIQIILLDKSFFVNFRACQTMQQLSPIIWAATVYCLVQVYQHFR